MDYVGILIGRITSRVLYFLVARENNRKYVTINSAIRRSNINLVESLMRDVTCVYIEHTCRRIKKIKNNEHFAILRPSFISSRCYE